MDFKKLIMSTLKGEVASQIPYVPRLDIWYRANQLNGTLPSKYKNASLRDIVDDLGVGFHAVVPDFRDMGNTEDDENLGLGLSGARTIPYKVILHNVGKKVTRVNGLTSVEYETPYGNIKTKILFDDMIKKSGATIAHVVEHAVKDSNDFKAAAYLFENAEVVPKYENYLKYKEYVGDRGIAVAFNCLAASPMHYIMKELMGTEEYFYVNFDCPEEMAWLAEKLTPFYYRVFNTVSQCPAEVILSGANYDSMITTPPFFKQHIATNLKKQSDQLHEKGKYLLTHTDGENKDLLELYIESGFDIADSICPAPLTSYTLKEIRDGFEGRGITIWGGIPSVSVIESSMGDKEFEKYLDLTMESIGRGDRIIFNIADTTPPDAKFERIVRIAERVSDFGPVRK